MPSIDFSKWAEFPGTGNLVHAASAPIHSEHTGPAIVSSDLPTGFAPSGLDGYSLLGK